MSVYHDSVDVKQLEMELFPLKSSVNNKSKLDPIMG